MSHHIHRPIAAAPADIAMLPEARAAAEPLSLAEQERLTECEKRITQGLATFIEVGMALMTIRSQRLYRHANTTFESYCRARWGFGRAHAYRLIESADMVSKMSPVGDIPLPATERQARTLLHIEPPLRLKVWQLALSEAGPHPATSAHIERALTKLGVQLLEKGGRSRTPTEGNCQLLQSLLRAQAKKLARNIDRKQIAEIAATLEHMKLLVERYGQ